MKILNASWRYGAYNRFKFQMLDFWCDLNLKPEGPGHEIKKK